jgi:hypothetical protein
MKKTVIFALATLALIAATSCHQIQYVPIETVSTEYRDNYLRDSIYFRDSIFVKERGDTLIMEKYSYLFRDKIIRDSIFKSDTIRVPYPVEVVRKVKAPLSGWQNFQVWCGCMALVSVLLLLIYFLRKRK